MTKHGTVWLVANARSGSNSPAALEALETCCGENDLSFERRIAFPDEPLPSVAALEGAGVGTLAVYAGDGTVNATVTGLYSWNGAILVLPGGTMNLLSKRLHGETPAEVIVERIANGAGRRVRPKVARTSRGDALAGLLAGPGTAWYAVREAMRDVDLASMAGSASDALAESTGGAMLRCCDPPRGRAEGYPLIDITAGQWGLQVDAYHAENPGEVLLQGWALLRRRFREGPHDRLALTDRLVVEDSKGGRVGLLIDGEPADGNSREEFTVADCGVDLLATENGS